jgi:hypothetical protein
MSTPTAFARSATHDGHRCVDKPQRRSRTKPLHRASGARTAAEAPNTIAAYAGVRPPPRQRAGIERIAHAAPDKRREHARLDRNLSSRCPVQRPVVAPSPRHLLLREEAQRLWPHQFRRRGNLAHTSTLARIESEPCTGPVLAPRPVPGEAAAPDRRRRAESRHRARTPLHGGRTQLHAHARKSDPMPPRNQKPKRDSSKALKRRPYKR